MQLNLLGVCLPKLDWKPRQSSSASCSVFWASQQSDGVQETSGPLVVAKVHTQALARLLAKWPVGSLACAHSLCASLPEVRQLFTWPGTMNLAVGAPCPMRSNGWQPTVVAGLACAGAACECRRGNHLQKKPTKKNKKMLQQALSVHTPPPAAQLNPSLTSGLWSITEP